jgi:hypothetical protein
MSCPRARHFRGREETMPQMVLDFEEVMAQRRHKLEANSGT